MSKKITFASRIEFAFRPDRDAKKHADWLAQCYRAANKQSPAGILQMGIAIETAHVQLEEGYLTCFYNKIGLARHGSIARRLREIGRSYPPFTSPNQASELERGKREATRFRRK